MPDVPRPKSPEQAGKEAEKGPDLRRRTRDASSAGADTPSGPMTDRTGKRTLEEKQNTEEERLEAVEELKEREQKG